MKLPVRIILLLLCAALIVSVPVFLSSPTMLSAAQEEFDEQMQEDEDGDELDFGRLLFSSAMAESEAMSVEDFEADSKLSIPSEWELPFDFNPSPVPDPDSFTENGYEDQSIRVRIEQRELDKCHVDIAYIEIASPTQLRTGIAGDSLSHHKSHYIRTIAKKYNAVIALNGDDYVEFDSKNQKSFEVRMTQLVTEHHKRIKSSKTNDTLIIDKNGDFHLFLLSDGLDTYVSQNNDNIAQALTFGPALVKDGILLDLTNRSEYAGTHLNSRSAIGQTGPLSYVMVVVESKKRGEYGMRFPELAQLMLDLGCTQAFNLDGGNSAELIMVGPDSDHFKFHFKGDQTAAERPQSDIIYFATAVPESERK